MVDSENIPKRDWVGIPNVFYEKVIVPLKKKGLSRLYYPHVVLQIISIYLELLGGDWR